MNVRSILIAAALLMALSPLAPGVLGGGEARAEVRTPGKAAKKVTKKKRKRKARARKQKVCRRVKGKRRCRWRHVFKGSVPAKSTLRTEPLDKPSGEIWLYAVNFREELKVNIYDEDGEFDEEALAKLDDLFRCKRSRQVRAVDPHLYEILSTVYDHFDQKRIELISGFREKPDRETSRHFHGSAMDIRVPGVSTQTLYDYAATLDLGGMGIGRYPVSDFVHIDFRAPGEKSYRWTDYSPPGNKPKRKKKRKSRRNRPNS